MYDYPPVQIPKKKGVHTKKAGRKLQLYVYQNTEYYRTETGQSRHKNICIGKVCIDNCTLMIPNDNYFSYYNLPYPSPQSWKSTNSRSSRKGRKANHSESKSEGVWHYGHTFLMYKIAKDTGLLDILETVVGMNPAMDLIAIAAHIIETDSSSMIHIQDWQSVTYLPYDASIFSSKYASTIFSSLTFNIQSDIFSRWIEIHREDETICYDVTSISTYSTGNIEAEYGYNRDQEKLKQFNLGYFSSLEEKIPLYCVKYNGSINDSSNLPYVIESASGLGLNNFHLFADAGFFYGKCFKSLFSCMKSFTIGMPMDRTQSKELVDRVASDIMSFEYAIKEFHVQCMECKKRIYGVDGRVLIIYRREKASDQYKDLDNLINEYETELSEMHQIPSNAKKYKRYFTLTPHKNDPGFDYSIDSKKINKIVKYFGYNLLFTNNEDMTPCEILRHYNEKDVDEKLFFQIKDTMGGKRAYTHNDETTDGKEFVLFIATILRSVMHNKLAHYLRGHSLPMERAIHMMANIMLAKNANGYYLPKDITKDQREILKKLDAYDILLKSIDLLNQP